MAVIILIFIPIVLADNNSNTTQRIRFNDTNFNDTTFEIKITKPCIEGLRVVCDNGEEVWTDECFDEKYVSTGRDCIDGMPGVANTAQNIKYNFIANDWKKNIIGVVSVLLLFGIIYLVFKGKDKDVEKVEKDWMEQYHLK